MHCSPAEDAMPLAKNTRVAHQNRKHGDMET
jgi:hypothetical protein